MHKTIYFLLIFYCIPNIKAANTDSSFTNIKVADVVVEDENHTVTLSNNSYTYYVHKKIRFNNDNKLEYANLIIKYNKSIEVKFNYGILYDKSGKEIKRIKKSDLNDIANMNEFASDQRMYVYEPDNDINNFPITVEYDYEIKHNMLVNMPTWFPVYDYNVEVKKSTYTLICKQEDRIRFIELNNAPKVSANTVDNKINYIWSLKNFNPIKVEEYSPPIDLIAPYVLISSKNISYNKFENKFEKWEDFGYWISKLNAGRDTLPDEIKNILINLTKKETSVSAKTNIVYKYFQSITRYVSIQFGIGGFQPQYAFKTFQLGYGDCKALSMLMVAMLKAVDIKAYYTLVLAGKNENIIKEFPSNQFNHAIVCVPDNTDTIWLECTNQKNKFNYLSNFTDDRDVLVIADKPFISHTKSYSAYENVTHTKGYIHIDENGDAKCDITLTSAYNNADYFYEIQHTNSTKEKQDLITSYFNFKNIILDSYKFIDDDILLPKIGINTLITAKSYATLAGKRLFIPLNRLHTFQLSFDNDSIRMLPFVINTARKYIDTIEFIIPNSYTIESKETSYNIETDYGKYLYDIKIIGNKIIYTRQFILNKGIYRPSEFQKIKSYFEDVHLKDNVLIIIKKET